MSRWPKAEMASKKSPTDLLGNSAWNAIAFGVAVALNLVVLPFVVSYLVASHGLVYGLALGIAPGMFAIFELPTRFFGASPVAVAGVVLLASLLLSGLSGLAGQRLALWRDVDAA